VQYCTQVGQSVFRDARQWDRVFIGLMASEFPRADLESWSKCQQLLSYCDVLYEAELYDEESVRRWVRMMNYVARYMQVAIGTYSEAEKLNWWALKGW
jgi:hypothetical protein